MSVKRFSCVRWTGSCGDENEKPMNQPAPESLPLSFKDRTIGLRVFGILTILLGCLCALFVLLLILGQVLSAKTAGTSGNYQSMIPTAGMYAVMAVTLVWLGIGSIMARRWARALLLIFSWTWLIMGIVALIFMAIFLPMILEQLQADLPQGQTTMTSGVKAVVMIISLGFVALFFVALPIVWILFYRGPHVRLTCEARNPVAGWTEACPLPILNISLWVGISALLLLVMPLSCRGVFPFFGTFVTGGVGTLIYLGFGINMGYSAFAMYKLRAHGWWLNFITFVVLMISHLLTYARQDLMKFYELAGYPEEQMEQLQKFSELSGNWVVWGVLLVALPFLGYLIYLKKHFRRSLTPDI